MGIYEDAYAHPELAEAIANKDCHEIARVLSIGRTQTALVELADVQALLQRTGVWWSIRVAAVTSDHPAKDAALVVLDVAAARYGNLDTTLPLAGQKFSELVAAGVMTQDVVDQINELSNVPAPLTQREVAIALYHDTGEPK